MPNNSSAEDKKVYVSGDVLNVLQKGEVIVSEGNSKAVSGNNTIKSARMSYNKNEKKIAADGAVEIYMKNSEGEPVEAFGGTGFYYTDKKTGELYGVANTLVKVRYFMKDSAEPILMNSRELYLDAANNTIKALKDVEVITSSGTIYSDNAFFSRDESNVLVRKDLKRPIADMFYEDKKGKFESDSMLFERVEGENKIKMRGDVKGRIIVEENGGGTETAVSESAAGGIGSKVSAPEDDGQIPIWIEEIK